MTYPAWEALRQHIASNLGIYFTTFGAILIAGIATMPERIPGSLQDWWAWVRNALQTAIPAARHAPPPVPTPPVDPANPKK